VATGDPRYRAIIAELRELRLSRGLKQAELAKILGRRQQFVSKYESLERRLDLVEFVDIAFALSLHPSGISELILKLVSMPSE